MNAIRAIALLGLASALAAQVTSDRIMNAADEPENWLTYNGSYDSRHFRNLADINRENAGSLELKWVWQARSLEKFEMTPLVVDDVMYIVQMPNDVLALDAKTGAEYWKYSHVPGKVNVCCGRVNRGLAMHENTLYMGTIDGKFLAIDATTGGLKWSKDMVDPEGGYSLTVAPLVIKDKLIFGAAGGE